MRRKDNVSPNKITPEQQAAIKRFGNAMDAIRFKGWNITTLVELQESAPQVLLLFVLAKMDASAIYRFLRLARRPEDILPAYYMDAATALDNLELHLSGVAKLPADEISSAIFASVAGVSESYVSKNKSSLGPRTLENAVKLRASHDGRKKRRGDGIESDASVERKFRDTAGR